MTTSKKSREEEIESALVKLNSDLDRFIDCHIIRGFDSAEDPLGLTAHLPTMDCEHHGREGHQCWLSAYAEERPPSLEDERLGKLHGNIRTIVQSLLDANRKLAKLASRDSITGVHNRVFFNEALQLEMAKANREGGHIMFIMIDIDHFKRVNDTEGHRRGDELLVEVARTLKSNVRASDLVIRYGGDEFLVVAPRPGQDKTCEPILDRLQDARAHQVEDSLSLSMGCATWSPGDDVQASIERADRRMYEQKKAKKGILPDSCA